MAYEITTECICCGACRRECPVEVITEGAEMYMIDAGALHELRGLRRGLSRRRDTGDRSERARAERIPFRRWKT